MAASVEGKTGYNLQFVKPPPDNLYCLICQFVARDPQQMKCCGKLLCNTCLKKLREYSTKCPHCKKNIDSYKDMRGNTIDIHVYHHKRSVHSLFLIPQVSKRLVHLGHFVTIHLMDVSGLESCVTSTNIQLAVALLFYHALTNVVIGLKWSSYFVKI